jgi:hypothetical protein
MPHKRLTTLDTLKSYQICISLAAFTSGFGPDCQFSDNMYFAVRNIMEEEHFDGDGLLSPPMKRCHF